MQTTPVCFIEFLIKDLASFRALQRVFDEIQTDKSSDAWRKENDWPALFGSRALGHFVGWTLEEQERWSIPEVGPCVLDIDHPGHGWQFFAMIDAFVNGEYTLLSCRQIAAEVGRIEFEPWAWPYGGLNCFIALVSAFGHTVTRAEYGTGAPGELPRPYRHDRSDHDPQE